MATTLLLLILAGYSLDLYLFLTRSLEAAKLEIQRLSAELNLATSTNAKLAQNLEGEKSRNDGFERQINQISGTVGTLQKLSQTDKELLQKYSKVYFLNENYKPKNLSAISRIIY